MAIAVGLGRESMATGQSQTIWKFGIAAAIGHPILGTFPDG